MVIFGDLRWVLCLLILSSYYIKAILDRQFHYGLLIAAFSCCHTLTLEITIVYRSVCYEPRKGNDEVLVCS